MLGDSIAAAILACSSAFCSDPSTYSCCGWVLPGGGIMPLFLKYGSPYLMQQRRSAVCALDRICFHWFACLHLLPWTIACSLRALCLNIVCMPRHNYTNYQHNQVIHDMRLSSTCTKKRNRSMVVNRLTFQRHSQPFTRNFLSSFRAPRIVLLMFSL